MPELTQELLELAHVHGVATEYHDWRGNHVPVPAATITAVLEAMDVDVSNLAASRVALEGHRDRNWTRMLPPCVVVEAGSASPVCAHMTHGEPVELWIDLESGERHDGLRQIGRWVEPRRIADTLVSEANFELPVDLPLGYHTLHARSADSEASCTVIVTPPYLGVPPRMGSRRTWGLATQLYSLRSSRSWGVGDLVDMTDLAVWAGSTLDAGYVLVNPLHAAEPVAPLEPSPYLPTSRRFFNPLYLRVERIPEYADLSKVGRDRVAKIRRKVRRALDDLDKIDRDTAWTAKREALRLVHAVPRTAGREADYCAYRTRQGEGLVDFATWSVLAELRGDDFRDWPAELRDPASAAVTAVGDSHPDEIDFHIWMQWVTDEQLQLAQAKAVDAGMVLGVMHDLAVGVHPGGADAWRLQDAYAQGVQVGAPPDGYNQLGQDWGQPPWRPDRLEELAYAPFRELIGNVLRHAGGVRVDHIIGLFRLWWVPAGQPPSAGTYVRYDHEALIGILALEAQRAGALVVGEDLGVVEPSARDYLRGRGIFGTSILWFEQDATGAPLQAEKWRSLCLASVTTHDLPPTAGYLAGDHVRLRDELGLLTRSVTEEVEVDEADRSAWLAEVRSRGLLPADADVERTVRALHEYIALTPARLLCVALVDAVGDRRTQNQPGTTNEYPNWRVPLSGPDGKPMLLEDVMQSARVVALADTVRRAGSGLIVKD